MIRLISITAIFILFCPHSYADDSDSPLGLDLYMQECSKCHGFIQEEEVAMLKVNATDRAWNESSALDSWLAIALPYGPDLTAVYGRPAGTVEDFDYSKAFKKTLSGVVWDDATLDEFLADSQQRAPGIRMFYRQPDADIRSKIILFLKELTEK